MASSKLTIAEAYPHIASRILAHSELSPQSLPSADYSLAIACYWCGKERLVKFTTALENAPCSSCRPHLSKTNTFRTLQNDLMTRIGKRDLDTPIWSSTSVTLACKVCRRPRKIQARIAIFDSVCNTCSRMEKKSIAVIDPSTAKLFLASSPHDPSQVGFRSKLIVKLACIKCGGENKRKAEELRAKGNLTCRSCLNLASETRLLARAESKRRAEIRRIQKAQQMPSGPKTTTSDISYPCSRCSRHFTTRKMFLISEKLCLRCYLRRKIKYTDSVAYHLPEASALFAKDSPFRPEELSKGSHCLVKIHCPACDLVMTKTLGSAVKAKKCNSCSQKNRPFKSPPLEETVKKTHPSIAALFLDDSPYKPHEVKAGSPKIVSALCNFCRKPRLIGVRALVRNKPCSNCKSSTGERELREWLEITGYSISSSNNKKIIAPYELDVVLEDYGVALEFNGEFYHSDRSIALTSKGFTTGEGYHTNKLDRCRRKGLALAFVWEDDWNDNKQELQRVIKSFINSHGRLADPMLLRLTSHYKD